MRIKKDLVLGLSPEVIYVQRVEAIISTYAGN